MDHAAVYRYKEAFFSRGSIYLLDVSNHLVVEMQLPLKVVAIEDRWG